MTYRPYPFLLALLCAFLFSWPTSLLAAGSLAGTGGVRVSVSDCDGSSPSDCGIPGVFGEATSTVLRDAPVLSTLTIYNNILYTLQFTSLELNIDTNIAEVRLTNGGASGLELVRRSSGQGYLLRTTGGSVTLAPGTELTIDLTLYRQGYGFTFLRASSFSYSTVYSGYRGGGTSNYRIGHAYYRDHIVIGIPTRGGVGFKAAELATDEVKLLGNYPNPFNPQTQIRFALAQAGPVQVAVYNALGHRVRVLAEGTFAAGTHSVRFDAADLPSGMYLYRLITPGGTHTKRMQLVR